MVLKRRGAVPFAFFMIMLADIDHHARVDEPEKDNVSSGKQAFLCTWANIMTMLMNTRIAVCFVLCHRRKLAFARL